MDIILTKNSIDQLNVFFASKNMNNISRPYLSYLKIDSVSKTEPIYHIGFEENMGFLDSYKVHGGIMIFEVMEGYPLQDLLFFHNKSQNKEQEYKYSLEELDPLDFYCVQKQNMDVYGDFILRKVKFISTKMDQGVNTYNRRIVAEFICSEMVPFRIPYFFNEFVSDNYNYHIIRNKKEIEQIKYDINSFDGDGYLTDAIAEELSSILQPNKQNLEYNFDTSEYMVSLTKLLDDVYTETIFDFVKKEKFTNNSAIMRIQRFIKEFYKYKNRKGIELLRKEHNLNLFGYKDLLGEDYIKKLTGQDL